MKTIDWIDVLAVFLAAFMLGHGISEFLGQYLR